MERRRVRAWEPDGRVATLVALLGATRSRETTYSIFQQHVTTGARAVQRFYTMAMTIRAAMTWRHVMARRRRASAERNSHCHCILHTTQYLYMTQIEIEPVRLESFRTIYSIISIRRVS